MISKAHTAGKIKKGTPLDLQTTIDWHRAMGHTRRAATRLALAEQSMDTS